MKKVFYIIVIMLLLLNCKSKSIVISKPRTEVEFFNDGLPAKETYYGNTATIDSVKTYYNTGQLKEVFYYNKRGNYHGSCYQLDSNSDLMVTWIFKNGFLSSRTDHKIPKNKNNASRINKYHQILLSINRQLKFNRDNPTLLYQQAYARNMLGNSFLALNASLDLLKQTNLPPKVKVSLYEILAGIYSSYENEDYSIQYKIKAIQFSDKKERLYYNLGAYFFSINSCKISEFYLNKVLKSWKNHGFSHWILANMYADQNKNTLAMKHINKAFEKEKGIIKYSSNKSKRDIRTTRGLLYHKLGESKKGIIDLEEALKLNPENSFAMLHLGIIYSDMGNHQKACDFLTKASELGYEKEFDRNDIEYYKQISCLNKKVKMPNIDYCKSSYIDLNLEHNIVKIENYPIPNFDYTIYGFNEKIISKGIAKDGLIQVQFLPPGLYILKVTNTKKPVSFRLLKV